MSEKSQAARIRRMAEEQGCMLVKSRRRDPGADDYGLYVLVGDSKGNRVGRYGGQAAVSDFANGHGMPLDETQESLAES